MTTKVDKFVKTYKALAQIPALLNGKITSSGVVSSLWSQRNVEKGKSTVFQRDMFIKDLEKIAQSAPIDVGSELLSKVSPNEVYRAVVRDYDNKKYLEVWVNNTCMIRVVDLNAITDSNIHGSIYTDGELSSFEWSPDSTKILYLAEKKVSSEPFYKRKGKEDGNNKGNGDEEKPKGEEYKFTQDWGEQLVSKKISVIAQYDIITDKVEIMKGLPEDICVGQVKYSPDGTHVIGVAYDLEPRKLGLIYCSNRKSSIFKLDFDENYFALQLEDRAVKCPIFTPNGKTILWLERKAGGPHASCMSLVRTPSPLTEQSEVKVVVDIVEDEVEINNDKTFTGLYCQGFIQRPWASGNRLIVSTNQMYTINSYVINIDTGKITELISSNGNFMVLDIVKDKVLAVQRNLLKPDKLVIGKLLEAGKEQFTVWNDLTTSDVVEGLENCMFKYLDLKAKGDSVEDFGAIYIGPKTGDEKSVPLVVWPHGGPHSAFGSNLFLEGAMFLSLGYAVLLVNFRGSVGAGERSVEFLLGKIGVSDVADCIQATDSALNNFNWLNPNAVALVGGSHGGFLVAHLSGQYPDKFKCVSSRNPVIDVASMSVISDIPDWCYVEAGGEYTQKGEIDNSILMAMRNASPIVHAHKVKAPTLLLIGSKDLRVPHHQGTEYYLRLKANGVITRMNLYDDEHPLSKVPNEMDAIINTLIWFDKHLNN